MSRLFIPVNMLDINGQLPSYILPFITKQSADARIPGVLETMGNTSWMAGNIAQQGCGVIAIDNVLLGPYHYSFLEIRDRMLALGAPFGFGLLGVNPMAIKVTLAVLAPGGTVMEHALYNRAAWIRTATISNAVIVLYKYKDSLVMHYVAGNLSTFWGDGTIEGTTCYYWFLNDKYVGDPSNGIGLSMGQYLDLLAKNGATPIFMWGIRYKERGL